MDSANTVLVSVFYILLTIVPSFGENEFIVINSCSCEGYDQVYECRVTGNGATVWKGTVFNCPSTGNEIFFLHSDSGTETTCNGGAIVGRHIRTENNTYISQLTVSFNAEIVGASISCSHDPAGQNTSNLIGSSLLTITMDPYPPPDNVYLAVANSSQLIFQWNPVTTSCEAVYYLINASNCGHCPEVTSDTTTTCSGFSLDGLVCQLAVQTLVCNNVTGNASSRVQVTLRAPDSPEIDVIPTYSYCNKTLSRLTTRFNKTETFNIAHGVDGSAISYTTYYTSLNSGAICKTDEISCMNRSCEHDHTVSSSTCFSSSYNYVAVTVSGINVLGRGPPSNPVTIPGKSDQFVDVSVDFALNIVTCLFHQQTESSENYCSIVYGPFRENCQPQNWSKIANRSISGSNVVFVFPFNDSEHFQPQEEYCFTVTACNGTFTAQIEGITTTILDTSTDDSMLGTTAAIGVFVTTIAITLLGLLITIFVIVKKKLKSVFSSKTQFVNQSITQRSVPATNNDSEVEQRGLNETNEQVIGIYSLLQSVGDEPPESQTKPNDPVYVDIGPSTTSHENTPRFLVPLCDDKVKYAEIKQTETREFNTDSKPVLLDKHLDLDNLLIQLRDDVTPHWYEFGVVVGVPKQILDKCKDYPPDQCIVEVLDYWLIHHHGQLTWRDVAQTLKEIQLHRLAKYILQNS